jgi:polyisoprenoid-binding protein YceI
MKRVIRLCALGLVLTAVSWWLAAGANRGWTKTSVPKTTVDEITGIEAVEYQDRFVPGLELLGGALLGAGILAGLSFFIRSRKTEPMKNLNSTVASIAAFGALAYLSTAASASPQTFDFKDPKGVNNVVFKLDAPLEAITGSASGITGKVNFDPANPAATTGKIVVAASSLRVPNSMMQGHLQGAQWMDIEKYPEISFDAKELKNVKTSGDTTTADAVGTLSIRGVSKEVTVPVKLTYLKDKLGQRVPNQKGDLLVIRSNFSVNRADYGINPRAPQDKVAETIDLTLSIAGSSPR